MLHDSFKNGYQNFDLFLNIFVYLNIEIRIPIAIEYFYQTSLKNWLLEYFSAFER